MRIVIDTNTDIFNDQTKIIWIIVFCSIVITIFAFVLNIIHNSMEPVISTNGVIIDKEYRKVYGNIESLKYTITCEDGKRITLNGDNHKDFIVGDSIQFTYQGNILKTCSLK